LINIKPFLRATAKVPKSLGCGITRIHSLTIDRAEAIPTIQAARISVSHKDAVMMDSDLLS
jgi:hypothetical protein